MRRRTKRILTLSLLITALATMAFRQVEDYFEVSKNLDIFATVYKEVNMSYVDDVKPGELIREAIDAMLQSLDPYTNFYSEAQAEDYRFQVTGSYGGIGATVRKKGDDLIIDGPEIVVALIIGNDKEDVGLFGGLSDGGHEDEEKGEERAKFHESSIGVAAPFHQERV